MGARVAAWGAIFGLSLLAGCATTGGGPSGLSAGRYGDVEVAEGPEGWLKLSPLACDSASQEQRSKQQRLCTGRIDLNGDGVLETIVQLYVTDMPSVISIRRDGVDDPSPLFQDEGYSLLVAQRRRRSGWPTVAAFGHGSTAELRIGASHRWREDRFAPARRWGR